MRVPLKTFLATAKRALTSPPAQRATPLTFVLGNESADLDSLCSAILLAYFRTHTPPHTLHIPLSNLLRTDLALRPELNAVLRPAGLKPDDLITLSDLPRDGLTPEHTRWLLVDHNAPTGDVAHQFTAASDASSSNLIIGCIDHHEDEGLVPQDTTHAPRIFAKSGSCMSLVIDHCKEAWDSLSNSTSSSAAKLDTEESESLSAQLAHLALGPILIDTTNLTSKDKTTEWDTSAVRYIEDKIHSSSSQSNYDRTAYFDEISRLKEDISGLSFRDVLRKDYKRWTDGGLALGISSVVQGLGYLTTELGSKDQFMDALRAWAGEQGLDIAAVMTVSRPNGQFTRELMVWAFGEKAVGVAKRFADENEQGLGLEALGDEQLGGAQSDGKTEWKGCWTQRRVENSRKQVAPLLREAMKSSSKL